MLSNPNGLLNPELCSSQCYDFAQRTRKLMEIHSYKSYQGVTCSFSSETAKYTGDCGKARLSLVFHLKPIRVKIAMLASYQMCCA